MYFNSKKLKGFYFADFAYRGGVSERNPHDKRGTIVNVSILTIDSAMKLQHRL